jgi:hypothetical protein
MYVRRLHSLCKVTTVRDSLAKKILNLLGLDAPLIPCASIFACDRLNIKPQEAKYVCLSYMEGGGHYDFGQAVDVNRWRETFIAFYNKIKDNQDCVLVCHNKTELKKARSILPAAKTFYSKNYGDYVRFYSNAKFSIGCRIHAAFITASFGRPAFVIGTDTRAKMVKEIGLKSAFVDEVDVDTLLEAFEELEQRRYSYSDEFLEIKRKARDDYLEVLSVL